MLARHPPMFAVEAPVIWGISPALSLTLFYKERGRRLSPRKSVPVTMQEPLKPCHGKGTLFCMNASEGLWRQWSGQLRAFLPELHGHRTKTLAFCVVGVVLAGTVRLPRVAEALGGVSAAKTPSIERRLTRFLANQQVTVLPLWTHLLGQFLTFWRDRRLVFVLDATALDDRATVLYLGLLVQSRLLPVSWQVLPVHQKWEQRQWEVVGALLDRVIPHLGHADCTLLADRGLVGHALVQLCQQRGWHYILRLPAAHTCQPQHGRWAVLQQRCHFISGAGLKGLRHQAQS